MYENEIWKDVPEFIGCYQVSNWGRVKTMPRFFYNKYTRTHIKVTEKIMAATHSKFGYRTIILSKEGHKKRFYIHRLVMLTFVGPANGLCVDHINGIKHDNRLENLRYVTKRENTTLARNTISKSGKAGVTWNQERQSWTSVIKVDNKSIYLGRYKDLSVAIASRVAKEKELGVYSELSQNKNC